ncbi:MAG: MarR family transcriptional regulator [Ignavibacteriae bacterium]|nr:MAG: MarR family transcriptional regulator [Ignavibacteriota bacterium]
MAEALNKWLKMKKSPPFREEVLLNVRIAAHFVEYTFDKIGDKFGITSTQYNVLRILKGAYPEGHARCEIISRMIETAPDTTRLIDRLEKQELVERDRSNDDRRRSITKITGKGLKLLEDIQPVLDKEFGEFTKNLNAGECKELSRLCEKLYGHLV